MTISTEIPKTQAAGNGSATVFPITWIFFEQSTVEVILTDDTTQVDTPQILDTDYTLIGGLGSTGSLTMAVPPPTGTTLTFKSNLLDEQLAPLPRGGSFPSPVVESMVDKAIRLIQQRTEELSRAVKLKETSVFSDVTSPEPVDQFGLLNLLPAAPLLLKVFL